MMQGNGGYAFEPELHRLSLARLIVHWMRGVPRPTDMSFISLALSRATTRAVSDFVSDPTLSPAECSTWSSLNYLRFPSARSWHNGSYWLGEARAHGSVNFKAALMKGVLGRLRGQQGILCIAMSHTA